MVMLRVNEKYKINTVSCNENKKYRSGVLIPKMRSVAKTKMATMTINFYSVILWAFS